MEAIEVWDEKHGFRLSMASVDARYTLNKITAVSPLTREESVHEFSSGDEYLAWTYATAAQRKAMAWGYDPKELDLSVWVLDPRLKSDTYSNLNACFKSIKPHTRDRFVIQHIQYPKLSRPMLNCFTRIHHDPKDGQLASNPNYHGQLFLSDFHEAYKKGPEAMNDFLNESGHGHAYSRGFLQND